jgi:predicted regulator of Ras-like GTPase activity (Roadblock/LC7/MglB family)
MTLEEKQSTTDTLTKILEDMNQAGDFLVSMVTDINGFPVVYATREGIDTERLSATISMVKKTISQNEKRLGISATSEISIVDSDGLLLICRSFTARTHELTLAVLMANRQQSYRRITSHTMNEVSRVWSKNWK